MPESVGAGVADSTPAPGRRASGARVGAGGAGGAAGFLAEKISSFLLSSVTKGMKLRDETEL